MASTLGLLIAQAPAVEDQLALDSQILAEQFYFFTVVIMWLIHAGFMAYEAGAARRKNVMSTAMKNILTIAVVTPSFYYFGWYIYGCFQHGGPAEGHIGPSEFEGFCLATAPFSDADGSEPPGSHQRRLLPRVPPLLLDDGLDHVGRAHRARAALRVPLPHRPPRLGRLDHGRRLGLELRRLARHALRLPRRDRVRGGARRRRRLHAGRPPEPRAAHREVRRAREGEDLPRPQPAPDPPGPHADLHGLLRLLRRLPRHPVDDLPGLAQHLPVTRRPSARSPS